MDVCIQICSKQEWIAFKNILNVEPAELSVFPFGEFTKRKISNKDCIIYNSGPTVTKSSAAAQYAINIWNPAIIIVLGTCGGLADGLSISHIILANKTVYYNCFKNDLYFNELIYEPLTTEIDYSWINRKNMLANVHEGTIATNDHYGNFDATKLIKEQNVLCVDWESAAIAYVCSINKIKCCIARVITDLPLKIRDEFLINKEYKENTPRIMDSLLKDILPILLQDI